jgi:hypothetical protein
MGVAILGCDAIRNEIEIVTAGDQDVVYREYLEFGLHLEPTNLKKVILEKLNSLPDGVDVVFLGYGHCQALQGLPEQVEVPVVMLEYEDCIAAILTSERYHSEKKNGGVTWFYPAGWAVNGMEGMVRLFHLDSVEGYAPDYFLRIMFDGFSRCLFIDTGIDCADMCEKNSKEVANILGLRHERTVGSLDAVRAAWEQAKELAHALEAEKDHNGHPAASNASNGA